VLNERYGRFVRLDLTGRRLLLFSCGFGGTRVAVPGRIVLDRTSLALTIARSITSNGTLVPGRNIGQHSS